MSIWVIQNKQNGLLFQHWNMNMDSPYFEPFGDCTRPALFIDDSDDGFMHYNMNEMRKLGLDVHAVTLKSLLMPNK